jgi:acyl-CoA dehydrogenase
MDRALPSEIVEFQQTTRKLVRSLLPLEAEFQRTGVVSAAVRQELSKLGYFGLFFEEKYGGAGLRLLAKVLIQAELAHLPPQFWAQVRSLQCPGAKMIACRGSEEQKHRYIPAMVRAECPVAFALTEQQAGSDVGGIASNAVRDDKGWILNGANTFISNAGFAKIFVICTYTDKAKGAGSGLSAFIVEPETPGFSLRSAIPLMGYATPGVHEIVLQDCRLPADALIGDEGKAFKYVLEGVNEGRLSVAAASLGMAELALSEAIAFAKQRTAFGKKIAEFQAIQHMLADSAIEQLLTDVAWHAEQHGLDGAKCSMAKLFCTEAGSRAVDRALQIFGGTGYCRGVIVERLYRDIRVSRIYEGSCEIQRNQIAKSLLN